MVSGDSEIPVWRIHFVGGDGDLHVEDQHSDIMTVIKVKPGEPCGGSTVSGTRHYANCFSIYSQTATYTSGHAPCTSHILTQDVFRFGQGATLEALAWSYKHALYKAYFADCVVLHHKECLVLN
eukprot:scaffold162534_cov19-Tisochrysis_lutea.AAC.2